jgi:hypothetical protein
VSTVDSLKEIVFRPTSSADTGNLVGFLSRAFNVDHEAVFLRPSLLSWKYWVPRGDFTAPRSYVLEADGTIIAHGGIWPVVIGAGEEEVRGCQVIDWAAAKESAGAGTKIMRRISTMLDFIQAIGGADLTRRVLPAMGFSEVAQVWRGARPLHPLRQILSHQARDWKLAPRLARNWIWSQFPVAHPASDWSVQQVEPADLVADNAGTPGRPSLFSRRTRDFFDFYLQCPVGRTTLHQVRNASGPQGHFLLLVLHGQARLAGVWLHNPTRESWRNTFLLAQKVAASFPDAHEFLAAGTRGESEQAAIEAGLRILADAPVFLLNRGRPLSLPSDYQFQFCDDDEAFLDIGGPDYRT